MNVSQVKAICKICKNKEASVLYDGCINKMSICKLCIGRDIENSKLNSVAALIALYKLTTKCDHCSAPLNVTALLPADPLGKYKKQVMASMADYANKNLKYIFQVEHALGASRWPPMEKITNKDIIPASYVDVIHK